MLVSICMTAYKRSTQLGVTLGSILKQRFTDYEIIVVNDGPDADAKMFSESAGAKYIELKRPDVPHRNSAVPNNTGLKAAKGEIILLQNAECRHVSSETVATLAEYASANGVAFAAVMAENKDGSDSQWYCHPVYRKVPYFFCGAITRKLACELGGFDERFESYGFEDDDFAHRIKLSGVRPDWLTCASARHQWHPSHAPMSQTGEDYLKWKHAQPHYPRLAPWPYERGVAVADLTSTASSA